jgi:photosystem II stability/assembly factor-like uncharacterized protein
MQFRRLAFGFISGCVAVAGWTLCAQDASQPPTPDMHWRMIGPFRGGRTRAATGVPNQPNVFYIGQVDGGVWKSDDYGRTWNPIFDSQPTQSIGAIAVAPSDDKIIYVASGEGLRRPDLSVGNGIYRSVDAGKTWTHLGLRDGQQIPALAIDPRDSNRIFAAVLGHPYGPNEERGIFRSTDGGQSWKKVLFEDANTGGSDVVVDSAHPDTVYASLWESRLGPWEDGNQYNGTHGGLFKSTDGGETWRLLTKGLPTDLVQINVAIASSDPSRLYATLATSHEGGYGSGAGLGVYRSDDSGESWSKITDDPRPAMKIGGGDLPVPLVDPKDPNTIYSASIVTCRSTDGGKTWTSLRGAPGGDDYQNLWINPNNPNIILLVSDQGALVSVNRGSTWSSWFNQPTAQLYHVAVTNTFPYQVCAGQQESGSVCTTSRGNDGSITFRDWHPVGVIEYGYVAPDPLHPSIIYGAGRTEVSKYDTVTGQVQNITPVSVGGEKFRADRTEPILFSPVDSHRMFYATNVLFETRDGGATWQTISPDLGREHSGQPASLSPLSADDVAKRRGAIYSLAASYRNTNTLWAGTDDGLLWVTRDHGKSWKDVTPPALTPWSKVTQIDASHFDDNTAYASISRFRVDDLHPYLFRTRDGGATWQSISGGLPDDAPVDTVREDPVRKELLFAGTESSVWMSLDDGDHWQSLQLNLPHTSVRDLCIKDNDLIAATHGRSFWILDDISPLRQLAQASTASQALLFKPGDAVRVRRSTGSDTPIPTDEPAGQNPPDGAVIDFSLPTSATGTVTLDILDEHGTVVRHFASDETPEPNEEELSKQLIPLYWIRMPRVLPSEGGMHRWVWDLHYMTPTAAHFEYPISAVPHDTPRVPQGPLALPGSYTVRLTANGKSFTEPLTIRMDPRVAASTADLRDLFNLQSSIASTLTTASEADLQAHSLREQIGKLTAQAGSPLGDALKKLDDELSTLMKDLKNKSSAAPELAGLDELAENAGTLYAQIGQADARPTAVQHQSAVCRGGEVANAVRGWDELKSSSLPKVNSLLRAEHLPALSLERRPETMPEGGDED